jgi:hypothetical protein
MAELSLDHLEGVRERVRAGDVAAVEEFRVFGYTMAIW